MPKVSIIIPVYNTAAYLRECLDSVIAQTLEDIEIIIVNDASPDKSQDIIDEYAAKDNRIIVLGHQENKGLGGARNTGIAAACGEYLMFLDSDDSFLPQTCAQALSYIENSPYQIVEFCKVLTDTENRKNLYYEYSSKPHSQQCYEACEVMAAYFQGALNTAMQTRIYRGDFFGKNQLCIPEHMFMEDLYIAVDIFHACGSLLKVNEILYRHRQHDSSISNRPLNEKIVQDRLKALEHQRELIFGHEEYEELRPIVLRKIKDRLLAYYLEHKKMPETGHLHIKSLIQAAVTCNLLDELLEELNLEWRSLGFYSRKRKLWAIARVLSQKLRVYTLLRPAAKKIRQMLRKA